MAKAKTKKPIKRSVKRTTKKRTIRQAGREMLFESDSTYFLKLVVVVILGTLWLKFATPVTWLGLPLNALPLGLLLGLLVIKFFEKHQSDRKIWYAVLVVIGVVSYFVPAGIII